MYRLDESPEAGTQVYECPVCGRQERQFGRVSSVQAERIEPHEEIRADAPSTDSPPDLFSLTHVYWATLEALSRWRGAAVPFFLGRGCCVPASHSDCGCQVAEFGSLGGREEVGVGL